eukprot:TRINITY_DN79169_c0_g1_i1.p1 TRINITY_DN79169_c0_g1~~TRINITY_DN79169_c0_g1_i1.p1  ORF type:complete len:214 (-),score=72.23 TRINITY_DN79169_c0_g1_i1:84-725(-)
MKPDWDKLAEEFPKAVFDVDCTADGKDLCEEVGVQGYPTIKHGDSSDKSALQAYEGGRDFSSLKKFAEENLAPNCGPDSMDACSGTEKELLEKFMKMEAKELESTHKALKKQLDGRQQKLMKRQRKLNDQLNEYEEDKGGHDDSKPPKGKEKQHAEKGAKFKKRKEKLDKEQEAVDQEKKAIKDEAETSGVRLMKVVIASRKSNKSGKTKTDL